MKKVRIAHIADFHLGGKINENNELSEIINKNLIKTLIDLVKTLNLTKVKLLLIAGDFYESSNIDIDLLDNVKEILSGFNGEIVISPGNHDYISLESVYYGKWPSNVHIFLKENIEMIEFGYLNTRVYGFGFNKSHISKTMIGEINDLDDDFINIGLIHGQIDSRENNYHPVYLQDIESSNLDYLALGHVHKRSPLSKIGNTYYAYSGNPMGRGFDETGEKGLYLGDISKKENGLHFYKLNNSQFEIANIKIDDFENQENIAKKIIEELKNIYSSDYKKHYYRIFLEGEIKKNQSINIDLILSYLNGLNYVEIINNTKLFIDLEKLKHQDNIYGKFINKVLDSTLDEKDKKEVLDIGIKALEGRLWQLKRYILMLLENLIITP